MRNIVFAEGWYDMVFSEVLLMNYKGVVGMPDPEAVDVVSEVEIVPVAEDEELPHGAICLDLYYQDSRPEPDEIEMMARKKLGECRWYLHRYWRDKETLVQSVVVNSRDKSVAVYVFGSVFADWELAALVKAISYFMHPARDYVFDTVHAILYDDVQYNNPQSGGLCGGAAGASKDKGIFIFPSARSRELYRIPCTTRFEGLLVHELGHELLGPVLNKWIMDFGWEVFKGSEILPGGQRRFYICREEKNCPSDYAKFDPGDDATESLVAMYGNYRELDPRRRKYLTEHFAADEPGDGRDVRAVINDSNVQLPSPPRVAYVRLRK